MGLYRSSGTYCTQCEAEGFRRITYFLDRPDVLSVFTVRIEAPTRPAAPVLLSNGNLVESGPIAGTDRHYAVWHDPFPKPSYLFAMVAGDLGVVSRHLHHHVRARGRAPHLLRARQGGALPLRHGRAQALDALGRGGLRPRIRPRHLHHRRRLRLQHGGDGEQGPQRLQRQVRPRRPRHRHRRRLRPCRGRHRPRIFPQLDRQPHHLPRLVPALPEGRPDRLPRPGILRPTCARAPSSASPTCARCRRASSPRTPVPSPIRSGRRSITRSTTSTRRPSTRRAPRSSAC